MSTKIFAQWDEIDYTCLFYFRKSGEFVDVLVQKADIPGCAPCVANMLCIVNLYKPFDESSVRN